MATEPTPDTPSAAELAEALRLSAIPVVLATLREYAAATKAGDKP